jgi:hypothetical protein
MVGDSVAISIPVTNRIAYPAVLDGLQSRDHDTRGASPERADLRPCHAYDAGVARQAA